MDPSSTQSALSGKKRAESKRARWRPHVKTHRTNKNQSSVSLSLSLPPPSLSLSLSPFLMKPAMPCARALSAIPRRGAALLTRSPVHSRLDRRWAWVEGPTAREPIPRQPVRVGWGAGPCPGRLPYILGDRSVRPLAVLGASARKSRLHGQRSTVKVDQASNDRRGDHESLSFSLGSIARWT